MYEIYRFLKFNWSLFQFIEIKKRVNMIKQTIILIINILIEFSILKYVPLNFSIIVKFIWYLSDTPFEYQN